MEKILVHVPIEITNNKLSTLKIKEGNDILFSLDDGKNYKKAIDIINDAKENKGEDGIKLGGKKSTKKRRRRKKRKAGKKTRTKN